ncbi:MAG TPA: hypothetical protein VKY27_05305 [Bacteriovoracaceae bacterium]|nr:hypothetical protein [Bacteriovoracaceae bacterium]
MKIILFLVILVSCGKSTNHSKRDFHQSLMTEEKLVSPLQKEETNHDLPSSLVFKTYDHVIHFKSSKNISDDFFEVTHEINRYYSFELSHIHPDSIYQLQTNLPAGFQLYLNDQGQSSLINSQNFKLNIDVLERLNAKKAFITLKRETSDKPFITIKNYHTNKTIIWEESIEDYLEDQKIYGEIFSLQGLIEEKGNNTIRWWIKKDTSHHYKVVKASLNELKDHFFQTYQYQKHALRRINGKGSKIHINNAMFIKVSGTQTLQKQVAKHFSRTYQLQMADIHVTCKFTESKSQLKPTTSLSHLQIKQILNITSPLSSSWSYNSDSLNLELKDLNSGYFNVGLIADKCPSKIAPKSNYTRVNGEKELDIVIESYFRKE